jgi:hypothetical protein
MREFTLFKIFRLHVACSSCSGDIPPPPVFCIIPLDNSNILKIFKALAVKHFLNKASQSVRGYTKYDGCCGSGMEAWAKYLQAYVSTF